METFLAEAQTLTQSLTPLHWGVISGVLLLLIALPFILSGRRKRKREQVKPLPALELFQISPLGRDAFLKIKNNGEVATLTSLFVRGRRDIIVKNAFAGHELERGKVYSILLEATADEKISANFNVEITYFDQMRNVYRQTLDLQSNTAKSPKLVQRGR